MSILETKFIRDVLRLYELRDPGSKYVKALRAAYLWIGPSLDDTPAVPRNFGILYDKIDTAALHLDPATFSRTRTLCVEAIVGSGFVHGLLSRGAGAAIRTAAWKGLMKRTVTDAERNALYRFVGWCCVYGIEPADVTQRVIADFLKFQEETSADTRLSRLARRLPLTFVSVASRSGQLRRPILIPGEKRRKLIPEPLMPEPMKAEWAITTAYYLVVSVVRLFGTVQAVFEGRLWLIGVRV